MNAIYGLYNDPEAADRAVASLRAAASELDIEPRHVVIETSEPFEEYSFGRPEKGTAMPWLAALGGLLGGVTGYALTALTQKAYPIPTGGMPIVALWTNGIVIYELTMLGAIIATLLTLLASARLPNLKTTLYDPAISDGKILVGVIDPPETSRAELKRKLRQAGAGEIRQLIPDSPES